MKDYTWTVLAFLLTYFFSTAHVLSQETFCEIAAKNIPFTDSTAVSAETVNRSVWSASRNQEFSSYEEFEEWSRNRDSGASYKFFSLSHGAQSSRSSGTFAERYSDFSESYEEALASFRSNSVGLRFPSAEFIERVLANCAPGKPIFVVVIPGSDFSSFAARMVFNTPGITRQNVKLVNAECREGNGRYTDTFATNAESATLECRRLNASLSTVAFNSEYAEASGTLETPETAVDRLEAVIGRQAIALAELRETVTQLQSSVDANYQETAANSSALNQLRTAGGVGGHDSQFGTWVSGDVTSYNPSMQGPEPGRNLNHCPPGQFVISVQSYAGTDHNAFRCASLLD